MVLFLSSLIFDPHWDSNTKKRLITTTFTLTWTIFNDPNNEKQFLMVRTIKIQFDLYFDIE